MLRRGGNPPKPAEEKRLEGDRGHRGKKLGVDPKGKGKPTVPLHLTAIERQLWAEAVASLPDYILSRADNAALELYITGWARYRDLDAKIKKTGVLVQTPSGPKRNPLFVLLDKAQRQVLSSATELGFTPVARARLNRPEHEGDPDDSFEQYIYSTDEETLWAQASRTKN